MIKKLLFSIVALAIMLSAITLVFVAPIIATDNATTTIQDVHWWSNVSDITPDTEFLLNPDGNLLFNSNSLTLSEASDAVGLIIPAIKDTAIGYCANWGPDANNGNAISFVAWNNSPTADLNSLIEFSLESIPADAEIYFANLALYAFNFDGSSDIPVGVYKQLHTDWEELQTTYNVYKTGSNWITQGGDYVTSNPAGAVMMVPSDSQGFVQWDIIDIVNDSRDRGIPVELLVKAIVHGNAHSDAGFCSKEYYKDTWLQPKLLIGYTIPSSPTPTPTPTPAPTTPVILVHGWASSPSEWEDMIAFLEGNGYERDVNLFAIDLNPHGIAWGPINWYAGDLAAFISEKAGANKVDLVCHSMGGLVSRWYTRFGYSNNVRNLIMIGTPNHGTPLAALGADILGPLGIIAGGVAGAQMIPYSPFLNELNYGNPLFYSGIDIVNPAVHHETIAGTVGWWYTWLFFLWNTNDGVVAEESVRLDGVNLQEVPYNHTAQINEDETFQMVLNILQGDTAYASAAVQQSSVLVQAEHDNSIPQQTAVQLAPMISGKIFSVEQKSHEILISATSNATFALAWLSGDLDLTLTTPSGTTIDPSGAEDNANISHYQDGNTTIEGYTILNPEIGIWQVNIAAVNVSAEGEDYTVLTFLETTLQLSSNLAKYQYDPGEQISIVAELKNDGTPLTGASVSTEIQRPEESVESLALYDDGLHGDGEANDGIYANAYANTTTSGMYKITIFANGMDNGIEFARQSIAVIWVEYYPDLTLESSDISFSDDVLVSGENVTISAMVSNIGEANAVNASIFFFDGEPADDVLIGEDVIDVNAGKTANVSVSWDITAGQHEIHVVVSPFNGFLEKDYTNNEGFKTVDVYNLTIFSSNGGIVATPGIGNYSYIAGESVALAAIPNDYYKFVNWTGDTETIADINADSTIIIMNGNCSIQANFVANPATYTFASGGGVNKWCWEGDIYLTKWLSGHPYSPGDFANSYGYAAGGTEAYSAVSSSDNVRWRSDISRCLGCCAFDRNAELFIFNVAEDPATISNIQVKWEGHGTMGETIYYTTEKIWKSSSNTWVTLNNQRNVTGDVTWTNNIASDCADYIDASGNLSILLAAQRSGLPWNCGIWTDYLEVTIIHK
ncbi:MAG: alpha/beta fold hydrolase [Dehalococcoidia bacterium]